MHQKLARYLLFLNYLLALGRAYIRVLGDLIFRRFLQQILEKTLQYEARDDIDKKKFPLVEYTVIRKKFFCYKGTKKDTLVRTLALIKLIIQSNHPDIAKMEKLQILVEQPEYCTTKYAL
jgi:hypothetical protein